MLRRHLIKIVISLITIFLMTGCGPQRVYVQALKPAEVSEMADKKKVAVVKFQNDKLGLSKKVEAELVRKRIDKKKYFTIVNRTALNKIIKEQKLQNGDLLDASDAAKIGKIAGAEVIITGSVLSDASSDKYSYEDERCIQWYRDGSCAKWRFYTVYCKTIQADVTGTFNIVDVEQGISIYADDIMKTYEGDTCKHNKVLSKSQALGKLAQAVANDFTYKLAPKYVGFNVALIESFDNDATSEQKEQLKSSLEYIKNGRIKKAQRVLQDLDSSLNGGSYEVAYNIALTFEALGKNKEALRHYMIADELSGKPHEYIDAGLVRAEKSIVSAIEAKYQMKKK